LRRRPRFRRDQLPLRRCPNSSDDAKSKCYTNNYSEPDTEPNFHADANSNRHCHTTAVSYVNANPRVNSDRNCSDTHTDSGANAHRDSIADADICSPQSRKRT
jgi:hypothetical protein